MELRVEGVWRRHKTKLAAIALKRIAANITKYLPPHAPRAELILEPVYLFIFSF